MRNHTRLTPHDILPYVNAELATLDIGAHPLEYLNPGKNPIRCDDKKYKGSIAAWLNYGNNGQITNVSIHTPKEGGLKNRTIKSRDILQQGYSPRIVSSQEIESQRQALARRTIAQKLATTRAREKANATYQAALENGTPAYFERKQVKPAPGIRCDNTTAIIPACRFKQDSNSLEIAAIQRISENGQKLFNKNAEISGLFFPIGNRENPQQIYLVEGVATALSIHQSLDNPNVLVVVCFDSGNIQKVVTEFARRYPMVYSRKGFVLCADNDQWNENAKIRFAGFKAISKTVAKFTNCLITYPDFYKSLVYLYEKHGIAKPTDFNDYAILEGSESVRWALSRQVLTAREFSQLYDVKQNTFVDDDVQREFFEAKCKARDDAFYGKIDFDVTDKTQVNQYVKENPNAFTPALHRSWVHDYHKIDKVFLSDDEYIQMVEKDRLNGKKTWIIVKSGINTNKTGAAVSLTLRYPNDSAINISHRISLAENSNQRLNTIRADDGKTYELPNFALYSDTPNATTENRITTVINSLTTKLGVNSDSAKKYSIVITDEFTQLFRHVAAMHRDDKPVKVAQAFDTIIKQADTVVLMDAGITDSHMELLKNRVPKDANVHLIHNVCKKTHVTRAGVQYKKQVEIYPYTSANQINSGRGEILNLADSSLTNELRVVMSTNSKDSTTRDCDELARRHNLITLDDMAKQKGLSRQSYVEAHGLKGVQYVVISSDNSKDYAQFFNSTNHKELLKDVRLFVTTPVMGAGVDIQNAGFDIHLGIFNANTTTSSDIVQQTGRFRDANQWHIAVEDKNYNLQENAKEILTANKKLTDLSREKLAELYVSQAIGNDTDSTLAPYIINEYDKEFAQSAASENRDKNHLIENLQHQFSEQGWDVTISEKTAHCELVSDAKKNFENKRVADICNAESISNDAYELLSKKSCTQDETNQKRRHEIESFYGAEITPELIEIDRKGETRKQIQHVRLATNPIAAQKAGLYDYQNLNNTGAGKARYLDLKHEIISPVFNVAHLFAFNHKVYSLDSNQQFASLLLDISNFYDATRAKIVELTHAKESVIKDALTVLKDSLLSHEDIDKCVNSLFRNHYPNTKTAEWVRRLLNEIKGFSTYAQLWKIAQITGVDDKTVKSVDKLLNKKELSQDEIIKAIEYLAGNMPVERTKEEIFLSFKPYFEDEKFVATAKSLGLVKGFPRLSDKAIKCHYDNNGVFDNAEFWQYYKTILSVCGFGLSYRQKKAGSTLKTLYTVECADIERINPFINDFHEIP